MLLRLHEIKYEKYKSVKCHKAIHKGYPHLGGNCKEEGSAKSKQLQAGCLH